METLSRHIESIIFASDRPVTTAEIIEVVTKVTDGFLQTSEVENLIDDLRAKYASEDYAFELAQTGGGYQFLSKSAYHDTIGLFIAQKSRNRLSTAQLETLAIVAYKQPVTKGEIEKVRGVNCDFTIQRLLEKELIVIKGRDPGPGRPIIYSTSDNFMNYFGINSVDDLPKLKEIREEESSIGVDSESQPNLPEVNPSDN